MWLVAKHLEIQVVVLGWVLYCIAAQLVGMRLDDASVHQNCVTYTSFGFDNFGILPYRFWVESGEYLLPCDELALLRSVFRVEIVRLHRVVDLLRGHRHRRQRLRDWQSEPASVDQLRW